MPHPALSSLRTYAVACFRGALQFTACCGLLVAVQARNQGRPTRQLPPPEVFKIALKPPKKFSC